MLLVTTALMACARAEEPTGTPTPWPTLAPVATLPLEGSGTLSPVAAPRLTEQYRVQLIEGLESIYPVRGEVESPVRIEVIVLSGSPDPVVRVNNPQGANLATVDTNAASESEVIGLFQFPADGYYELAISTAGGSGEVGVSIYQIGGASSHQFETTDEQVTGEMTQPAAYHTFLLPLERSQRVDIAAEAVGEGLTLTFALYAPDGTLVAQQPPAAAPTLLDFVPSQQGDYTLVLRNLAETLGSYTVAVAPSESAGEAAVGTRTTLDLTAGEPVWLTLDGTAYDSISLEARPADPTLDLTVRVYDPFGGVLVQANDLGLGGAEVLTMVQFPFDGLYQVEFTMGGAQGTIDYLIRRQRLPDIEMGGRIAQGSIKHEGAVEGPGTLIAYGFDAVPGDLIGVDARAVGDTDLDLAFSLYAPDGTRLLTRDNVVELDPILDRFDLRTEGRYVLVVFNRGTTTGAFELYLTNPQAPAPLPTPP
ncbi:MAG: hypothetical protein ACFB51_02030 [Anaerolineae bacterium]